jgi:hypothetical protein
MFPHYRAIIREFTTDALLSYTRFQIAAVVYTIIKANVGFQIVFVEITIFKIIKLLKYYPSYNKIE